MSWFRAPPGARVTSLCLAKEKSPRERPPRERVLRTSMCYGFARARRGSPPARPCADDELARMTRHIHVARPPGRLRRSNWQSCRFSLRAILRTDPSSVRRVRGAPIGAHPVRMVGQSMLHGFASSEAVDGRHRSTNWRRWRCRDAQPNGGASAACSSAGMREFGAAAVRRASQGNRDNRMLSRSPPPATSLFRPFLGNAKKGPAPLDGAEKDRDVERKQPRHWIPAFLAPQYAAIHGRSPRRRDDDNKGLACG